MILFILSLVLIIVGFIALIWAAIEDETKAVGAVLLIIGILAFGGSHIKVVPVGNCGVVTTFGKIEDHYLEPGVSVAHPWVEVHNIDTREQLYSCKLAAFSADIQEVDCQLSFNYRVDPIKVVTLYRSVGENYVSVLLQPKFIESAKNVIADYSAESIIQSRAEMSSKIRDELNEELDMYYGIHIVGVNMEDIDFTDAFTDAVEAKQVATQRKLQVEVEQSQKTAEAKGEAERAAIAAQSKADVAKIEADAKAYATRVSAEAEAEANKKLADSITPELIDMTKAKNWNGELPTYMGNGTPILSFGE